MAGLVAIGEKNGSTGGRVTAMCNCVSTLWGPAGLGTIMTSGITAPYEYEPSTDCRTSFTTLKFARLVKWTITTEEVEEAGGMGEGGIGELDTTRGTCVVERRE